MCSSDLSDNLQESSIMSCRASGFDWVRTVRFRDAAGDAHELLSLQPTRAAPCVLGRFVPGIRQLGQGCDVFQSTSFGIQRPRMGAKHMQ